MIRTFCVTHKPLLFPLPKDVPIVWMGNNTPEVPEGNPIYKIRDISEEYDTWHNFLGGSAGTFAIERMLSDHVVDWNPTDLLSIVQYRKFVGPTPIGPMSETYYSMHLPTPEEVLDLDLHAMQKSIATQYLLPQLVGIGHLTEQYATAHHAQDLLRYTAIAIDMGVLHPQGFTSFLDAPHLIPGGIELGIYPIEVFLRIIREIQAVCMEFLKIHRPTSLSPYQRRALAFCNERLGSHLLFKALNEQFNQQIPLEIFGYMHNVTDHGIYIEG